MKSRELLTALKKAASKLKEAHSFPDTEPMRESTIQRFEYNFELSWKLMSSILADQGLEAVGIRNVIRSAAKLGLIDAPELWFEFADARHKTSHIYREEVAQQVYMTARGVFLDYVEKLIETAERMIEN